jgi:hypothetical protein
MNVYRAFVVRCWQEDLTVEHAPAWRFALLEIGDEGQARGFADYDELAAFLKRQLTEPSAIAAMPNSPRERAPEFSD